LTLLVVCSIYITMIYGKNNNSATATIDQLPKHVRIRLQLKSQIKTGQLSEGQHFYTEKQICKKFGVGNSTAKRILNDLREEGIVERRRGAGTFLSKDALLRITTKRKIIGVLLYDEFNPLVPGMVEIIDGIRETIKERKYDIKILISTTGEVIRIVKDARLDGLVVGYQELPEEDIQELVEICPALVALNRSVDMENVHTVSGNHLLSMLLIGEHLNSLGHKRVAFFHGPLSYRFTHEYLRGYQLICDRFDFEAADGFLVETGTTVTTTSNYDTKPAPEKLDAAFQLLKRNDRPTAIIVPTYHWVDAIATIAQKMSLRIPDDLSVVLLANTTVDGVRSEDMERITHIRENNREFGRCTGKVLLDLMDGNGFVRKNTFVKSELVPGQTTGPAPR